MSAGRLNPPLEKHCSSCGRRIAPRRRWKRILDDVRYCSRACRGHGVRAVDLRLEEVILALLSSRGRDASLCPSEAARAVAGDGDWRELMEAARRAARRLVHRGRVEILQRGQVVDPSEFRGPVRVRSRR